MSVDAAVIETMGLTKAYGETLAVDHLDISVQRGSIFGFLGPNGAGKTTTMRMLLGLVRPSAGEARILGMNIKERLAEILARTGSIIENPTFYPYLSGRNNLRAVARLTGAPNDNIARTLDLVDLTGAADRRFKTYSLGMKQRLAVGAALLNDPDLLILDEPANGLDPAGIVEMRDLMRRLREAGHTVMISSHVLHEIEQICDHVVIMNRGRVVVQGSVPQLLGGTGFELCVDDLERAAGVLRSFSWVDGVTRNGERLVVDAAHGQGAEITRVLAENGLYLSELRPSERSLEQYFLDVTAGTER